MIPEIIKQWEENKHKLEEYFRTTKQEEYSNYKNIVIKIFELCLLEADEYCGFDINKMTVIDDGDYQGTKIFIIPKNKYQPTEEDYITTNTSYGSCSGCDTLKGISEYEDGLPTENQVKMYMTLALHLVQKLKWLPQPSNDFIKVFVEEYNNGNKIQQVNVEYEERMTDFIIGKTVQILKVNSKNEISIRKIKDTWTREEVINFLNKALIEFSDYLVSDEDVKEWIEQNL